MKYKLIKLLQETFEQQYEKRNLLTAMHTAEYLLENGVIVPPCKVGQRVWMLKNWGALEIIEGKVSMIYQKADKSWKFRVTRNFAVEDFKTEEIGKRVFFTVDEAKNALKERLSE